MASILPAISRSSGGLAEDTHLPGVASRSTSHAALRVGTSSTSRPGSGGGQAGGGGPPSPRVGVTPQRLQEGMKALNQQLRSLVSERQRQNDDVASSLVPPGLHGGSIPGSEAGAVPPAWQPPSFDTPGSWLRALASSSGDEQAVLPPFTLASLGDAPGAGPGAGSGRPASGAGPRSLLPTLRSSRKEEVGLLQAWLDDMVQQQVRAAGSTGVPSGGGAGGGKPPAAGGTSAQETADSTVRMYSVAAEELRRQVAQDSRERGELLGAVVEALCAAVAAQTGLSAERRLAAAQQRCAAALEAVGAVGGMGKGAGAGAIGAGAGAADPVRLSRAVWTAEELGQKLRMVELTLQGEVARRQEAEQQLANTKLLLGRTEHEWLRHRATSRALDEQVTEGKDTLEKVRKELETARREAAEVRRAMSEVLDAREPNDTAAATMRREFAASEILLVSLQQQVKELESQLQSSKAYGRQQALMLMDSNQEIDRLVAQIQGLEADLAENRQARAQAEVGLQEATVQLVTTRTELAATAEKLDEVVQVRQAEVAAVTAAKENASDQVKRLRSDLDVAVAARSAVETKIAVMDEELESVREAMMVVAQALDAQGIDVPQAGDKSWEVLGALGALQRCIPLCGHQLEMLYGQREAIKAEHAQVSEKLKSEMMTQRRLQQELYQVRTDEAATMRAKEEVVMQLDTSEQVRRNLEAEVKRLNEALNEAKGRVMALEESSGNLQRQVDYMMPFEAKFIAADTKCAELEEQKASVTEAYHNAREDIAQLMQSQDMCKEEIDRLLGVNVELMEKCRQIPVLASDLEEMTAAKNRAVSDAETSRHRMEDAVSSAAAALQQLELSKFLLQSSGAGGQAGNVDPEQLHALMAAANAATAALNAGRPGPQAPGSAQARMMERERTLNQIISTHNSAVALDATSAAGAGAPLSPTKSRMQRTRSSRCTSARSNGAEDDEEFQYGMLLPPEVLNMMADRGFGQYVEDKKLRWLNIKIQFMAHFSKKLRVKLQEETERRMELELELLQKEADMLEEARAREEFISAELFPSLRAQASRVHHEASRNMAELRCMFPHISTLLSKLASKDATIGIALMTLRQRLSNTRDIGTMTDGSLEPTWAEYTRSLPREPPNQQGLSVPALLDTIVRVYVSQVKTIEILPVWGPPRQDTIWDALMAHYTSATAPDTFDPTLLSGPDSAVGRLLRSAMAAQHDSPKVAMFCYFLGVSEDAVHWSKEAWHFFLHLIYTIKLLLGGSWRATLKQWATPQGATIPVQAGMDLVGNLFNVQEPQDLEGAVSSRLAGLVIPGQSGPTLDLDAFFLLLVSEHNLGNCPRNPLLYPRRLTDGTLFNIFNAQGNAAYVDGILGARVTALISSSPSVPASPIANRLGGTATRSSSSGGSSLPSPAAVVQRLAFGATPGVPSSTRPTVSVPAAGPLSLLERGAATPTAHRLANTRGVSRPESATRSTPARNMSIQGQPAPSGSGGGAGSSGGAGPGSPSTTEGAAGMSRWQVQLPGAQAATSSAMPAIQVPAGARPTTVGR